MMLKINMNEYFTLVCGLLNAYNNPIEKPERFLAKTADKNTEIYLNKIFQKFQ